MLKTKLDQINKVLKENAFFQRCGYICEVNGLIIESEGPKCALGERVSIFSTHDLPLVEAEVVGFKQQRTLLMPLGESQSVSYGCKVVAGNSRNRFPIGVSLQGRVLNALGQPIDNKAQLVCDWIDDLYNLPPHPLNRPIITDAFETSIKAIDAFVPLGIGQRVGIFAGSGVGKSTLLGMMARGSKADINVIALVGERGRELNEFILNDLGPEGVKKSVIVVATSDQPAPLRVRAAFLATRIAEYFRDQGKNVLFLMDSVTRLAMAQREIGLSIGEPPATRGYPPSVFALFPKLMERAGRSRKGNITAFYTVLVEGDDFNEPVSDTVRSILDGHIILSRSLATANHFPAIDVLESISRLARQIMTKNEWEMTSLARDLLSIYRKNEDLITVGAYKPGNNPKLDRAVQLHEKLMQFLKQSVEERYSREKNFSDLKALLE